MVTRKQNFRYFRDNMTTKSWPKNTHTSLVYYPTQHMGHECLSQLVERELCTSYTQVM